MKLRIYNLRRYLLGMFMFYFLLFEETRYYIININSVYCICVITQIKNYTTIYYYNRKPM